MRNAVAFANNDIIMIAWSYGQRPDNCMGFALYRIDGAQKRRYLIQALEALHTKRELRPAKKHGLIPL